MSESILQEAQRLTHGDRNADYGHPHDDYSRVARLWEPILGLPPLSLDPAKAALCMVAVKIARECHRPKRDNRTDMAGYAWVVDAIRDRQNEMDRLPQPSTAESTTNTQPEPT